MKNVIILLTVLCFSCSFSQQKIIATMTENIEVKADSFIGYDNFGALYYIKDNVFQKVKDGESLEYKNLSLGKITRVDLQNPLKIMLFYEDFNTIVTVDNQLNETQKINFSEISEPLIATAAGMASQNRFWIYNSLTQQLGLFDYLKNTFTFIAPPVNGNIKAYDADFNDFQWVDDQNNWFSCDVYGKVRSLGKIPQSDRLIFAGKDVIVFSADGGLYLYELKNDKRYHIENIDKSIQSFFFKDQILSIFTNRGITNYKIHIP
jgi:hypothetical protein